MIMYKLIKLPNGSLANSVENLDNNAFIPFDPDNTDYQQYLAWLAEGNTPEEADNAAN